MPHNTYNDIISVENLLQSWCEFLRGKRKRKDVAEFSVNLMDNILHLHAELWNKTYRHGSYEHFKVSDPKPRDIHKAHVRDRLVHHAIHRILYPYFDTRFIHHSYSCRNNKGTHRAMHALLNMARKASNNHTKTVWVLQCDIKKFFANIDHDILKSILRKHISDGNILWLLDQVIDSFGPGLPLGNLTSQLLVNIYMNEFDQWAKYNLKVRSYIRYADDFVVLDTNRAKLESYIPVIGEFLLANLDLELHPHKVTIQTIASGVDFLGWVHFTGHRVLRTSTKRRMLKRIGTETSNETIQSYLGLLRYGNAKKLRAKIASMQQFSDGGYVAN